jgi:hypothetical protein
LSPSVPPLEVDVEVEVKVDVDGFK